MLTIIFEDADHDQTTQNTWYDLLIYAVGQ